MNRLQALGSVGRVTGAVLLLLVMVLSARLESRAQEKPYFVTYSQDMEEPGNLEYRKLQRGR